MGILKNFFVEEITDETVVYDESYDVYADDVDVNTDNVTQENLITDIYDQNNLSDLSKSIFKIEELINSLPKEMPNETKKATVLQMLSIFGLTVDEIAEDGSKRLDVIESALRAIVNENNGVIDNNNANIEQKKLEIQELEKDNSDREAFIKGTEDRVESEIKRIDTLIKFIRGAE